VITRPKLDGRGIEFGGLAPPPKGESSPGLQFRPVFEAELQQAITAVEIEFGANVGPVGLYCAITNPKFLGDLFARAMVGNPPQNLPFSCR
jgi:hypothetical protein